MSPARMLRIGLLALLLVAPAGCQRRPSPLSPVNGKISYRGAQLPGGLVVFTPDAARGTSGALAFGKIRDDGSYTLYTGDTAGASAGWYKVSVAALSPAQAPPDHLPPPVSLLPEHYRDPKLSLLTCEVKSERVNQLDFNLD